MEARVVVHNESESVSMAASKVSLQNRPSSFDCRCLLFTVVVTD